MAQAEKDNRVVIKGDQVREKLLEGAQAAYETVTSTYGPKGRNVMVEKPFGRPILTRDGVTVARETYFKDRAKNMGAQQLLEASETTNRIAGDGTTATVALGYHLMKRGVEEINRGTHPMEVSKQIQKDGETLLEGLTKLSKPTKKNQLQEVATVSSGDPLLGQLIAEAIDRVGADGGIITEKTYTQGIEREYVDGYFLQTGFQALQAGKKELISPSVIVTNLRLSSAADAIDILTKTARAKNLQQGEILRLLFIGNIEEAAYNTIVENINRGIIDAIILKTPPQFGAMGTQLLEDIAVYAGCDLITDSTNLKAFDERYIGSVNRVVANKTESTLFADHTENIEVRVSDLKDQIENEPVDAISEKLRDRVAKLEGKIALFRIGGATDTVKEELEFRVEDAILATRAAFTSGIVAGGGVTLVELSKLDISELYRDALRDTFSTLLSNANFDVEKNLKQVLEAEKGFGFNLREDETLVDVVKEGILDPTLVVEQIITNATATVGASLTTDTLILFEDEEKK